MVAGPEIELGEEPGAMEFIQELVDDRDGECVLDGDGIQRAVVDAESPRAVCFLDEEDRGREC
jgi:NAD(P)H-hydrate repair Nnr-like enzyme with NAD(P)H-hydrate dehydratase domain